MGSLSKLDIKRKVKFQENKLEELAEFIGILTGDGYINQYRKYDYIIEIAGNKLLDKEYLENYVQNLIKNLFNITATFIERKDQNTIYLRILSKGIFSYLKDKGFKEGRKERIGIPDWIISKNDFMTSFVRGLFDTDGAISLKNKEGKIYPVISITSKSDILLLEVKKFIESQGLTSYLGKEITIKPRYSNPLISFKLQVSGKNNLNLWFEKISSNNSRNLLKFNSLSKDKV